MTSCAAATTQNAFRALDRLLNLGVVPVVNENDTVATHKIRFGDNDRLSALVAHLVRADALVLLSDVDSLYDGPPAQGAKRIPQVDGPQDLEGVSIGKPGKAGVGTGGMQTKVEAAPWPPTRASRAGHIHRQRRGGPGWRGRRNLVLGQQRPQVGAHDVARAPGPRPGEAGPRRRRRESRARQPHRSLLPAGITAVKVTSKAGDAVEMVSPDGTVIARGLVNYSAEELPQMLGRSTQELGESLGRGFDREVVHVDDLVLV
jgi:glutamate 5-kinase